MVEVVIPPRRSGRFRSGFRKFLLFVVLLLFFLIYWFFINVSSDGNRNGLLIKFSRKGNIFKTNEGEVWLGCRQLVNPEKFYFSVTDDSVANLLKDLQGRCVQVSYVAYRAKLPWRGDSKYIVKGVTVIHSE